MVHPLMAVTADRPLYRRMASHYLVAMVVAVDQQETGQKTRDQFPVSSARCLKAEKANHFQTVVMGYRYPMEVKEGSLMEEMADCFPATATVVHYLMVEMADYYLMAAMVVHSLAATAGHFLEAKGVVAAVGR